MGRLSLSYRVETHRLKAPFRIAGRVFETSDMVIVELADGDDTGRGEGAGVFFLGDDADHGCSSAESDRFLARHRPAGARYCTIP